MKITASIRYPAQGSPSKKSEFRPSANACISRIRARKAKTPAAMPTAEPRASVVTFSLTSVLASSISSRIRFEVCSVTS